MSQQDNPAGDPATQSLLGDVMGSVAGNANDDSSLLKSVPRENPTEGRIVGLGDEGTAIFSRDEPGPKAASKE
ncbi:hypothetical protein ACWCYZ_46185 [Streptomyces virginiae]